MWKKQYFIVYNVEIIKKSDAHGSDICEYIFSIYP